LVCFSGTSSCLASLLNSSMVREKEARDALVWPTKYVRLGKFAVLERRSHTKKGGRSLSPRCQSIQILSYGSSLPERRVVKCILEMRSVLRRTILGTSDTNHREELVGIRVYDRKARQES
jgi:hypothetical protein